MINAINPQLIEDWQRHGARYTREVNEMLAFGEKHGWDKWKGAGPKNHRDHLADEVIHWLRRANREHWVDAFREHFPPAHAPFIAYFEKQGQSIEQVHCIEGEKIVFLLGAPTRNVVPLCSTAGTYKPSIRPSMPWANPYGGRSLPSGAAIVFERLGAGRGKPSPSSH